jgi:hypothetical protein
MTPATRRVLLFVVAAMLGVVAVTLAHWTKAPSP